MNLWIYIYIYIDYNVYIDVFCMERFLYLNVFNSYGSLPIYFTDYQLQPRCLGYG